MRSFRYTVVASTIDASQKASVKYEAPKTGVSKAIKTISENTHQRSAMYSGNGGQESRLCRVARGI